MKIRSRAAVTAMAFFLCFISPAVRVSAEEAYTYTVTFYAGNQAAFVSSEGLFVRYQKGTIQVMPDRITVSGLNAGDIVSFDAQAGALNMEDAGKYYVKGMRESGRDNNTVTASAFKVEGDADYVIAYGIKGDTVAYKVNYQDEEGNTLAESRTYYGNVGDKAVAAYLYMEGYTPRALAIAKTLSTNEAENVLTFQYVKDESAGTDAGTQTENTGGSTGTQTGTTGQAGTQTGTTGQAGTQTGTTGQTGTQTGTTGQTGTQTGTTGQAETADGNETADAQDGAEDAQDNADAQEDAEDLVNLQDDEVPLEQELLDLDDEEVPQANVHLDEEKIQEGIPFALHIGIGAAAAAALLVLAVMLMKRRKAAKTKAAVNKKEKECK